MGGAILVHVGTKNAEKEGKLAIVGKYRRLIKTLKEARVGQIVYSRILPIMGSRGEEYRNCRRMAIDTQVQKVCMEETGSRKLFKLDSQGELTEKTQRNTTTNAHPKKCSPIISDNELKYVCLNARRIINKKSELDIMVADINPRVIGITESWANNDILDAELALTGYVMFRKDRRERRGGGVILYIKEYIQAYEITLKSEADCEEAIWCNIVTRNSTLTIGVVYRSPNIGQEEDVKLQKAITEVSKWTVL